MHQRCPALTFEIGLDCNGTCIRLVGCTFFKGNADEGSITVAQALKYYTTNLYGEKKKSTSFVPLWSADFDCNNRQQQGQQIRNNSINMHCNET